MDNRFEALKSTLFKLGLDSIEDFLGDALDHWEDKEVIERRLDGAYKQMPDDVLEKYYEKFGIAKESKFFPSDQTQNVENSVASQSAPIFLFEEDRSGDRMGKPGDGKNVYYANWFEYYSISSAGIPQKETASLEFSSQGERLPGGGHARGKTIQDFADAQSGRDVVVLSIEYSRKDLKERIFAALSKYEKDNLSVMFLPSWQKAPKQNVLLCEEPKTRRLHVTISCQAVYESGIDVPIHFSLEESLKYAKEHISEIPLGSLNYIPDSDVLDEENCDFESKDQVLTTPLDLMIEAASMRTTEPQHDLSDVESQNKDQVIAQLVSVARNNILELESRSDLESRNNDSEDFFTTSIWNLKSALVDAYNLGKEQALAQSLEKPSLDDKIKSADARLVGSKYAQNILEKKPDIDR